MGPLSVPGGLSAASHVYVRHDAHRSPLQAPYDGPFRVLTRHPKHFLLDINGRHDKVSLDRLKPAHGVFTSSAATAAPPPEVSPQLPPSPCRSYAEAAFTSAPAANTTRSGRSVRPPVRFPSSPSFVRTAPPLGEAM